MAARRLPALTLVLTLVLTASRAHADAESSARPSDPLRPHWELAAKAGYGSPPIQGGTTPFGAAIGGRLAYAPSAWVVGVSVVRFLGATDVSSSNIAWRYGADVGHGFRLPWSLVLRPHLGAGGLSVIHTDGTTSPTTTSSRTRTRSVPAVVTDTDVITSASSATSSSSSSSIGGLLGSSANSTTATSFYLEPGVALLFTSGAVFVGADAAMLFVPSITYGGTSPMTWISYGASGELGVMF